MRRTVLRADEKPKLLVSLQRQVATITLTITSEAARRRNLTRETDAMRRQSWW
jgi:hypothetical protein